jgi:hypothetical protein
MPVRFLISTLKAGVDPEEYEAWVKAVDYPFVGTKSNYLDYEVHRIRRPIANNDDLKWQYIERINVGSIEQHEIDMTSPEGVAVREQLYGKFLDREKNVYFTADLIDR